MAVPYSQVDFVQTLYNARAPKYDESFHARAAAEHVETLDLKPGERLLDLACGTGLLTLLASKKVGPEGRVVGVDVTPGMLAELDKKTKAVKDEYNNVTIYEHDITRLPDLKELQPGSFDAISCAFALVLLLNPQDTVKSWLTYLKPGGRLITDMPDQTILPWHIAMDGVFARLDIQAPSDRTWARDGHSLRVLLEAAGYDVHNIWSARSHGPELKLHDIDDAETVFDRIIKSPPYREIVDRGLVAQAKKLFTQEWTKLSNKDGKVKETDMVWCALAHRPDPSKILGRGSCACGAVTWSSTAKSTSSNYCYCTFCRKIAGAPALLFMRLPAASVSFKSASMKTVKLSKYADRGFCGECGSSMTMVYVKRQEVVYLSVGSIDEEGSEEGFYGGPNRHIYTRECPKWFKLPEDGLERQETMTSEKELLSE